jgi:oligoribonuclease NrnB/cAMP/cGMP phosphodiesterase (DHH superfamily)
MIEEVIQELASQYAKRIIDHHLGEYDLEEGEIIDEEWSLEDMRAIAKRIVMRYIVNAKEPIVTTYDEVYGSGSI